MKVDTSGFVATEGGTFGLMMYEIWSFVIIEEGLRAASCLLGKGD